MLCAKGAHILQTKSQTVEEAANELINMLCAMESPDGEQEAEEEEEAALVEDTEEAAEGLNVFDILHLPVLMESFIFLPLCLLFKK